MEKTVIKTPVLIHQFFSICLSRKSKSGRTKMDMLIKVNSGWIDTIMPSLLVASKLKKEGVDVIIFF